MAPQLHAEYRQWRADLGISVGRYGEPASSQPGMLLVSPLLRVGALIEMIFSLFGDRGRAKKLVKLATATIAMMERMLRELQKTSPDRKLIEEHLSKRVKALERYSMLARGEIDDVERLMPTMRNYETWRRSMENEIEKFSSSTEAFVWYLQEIKKR